MEHKPTPKTRRRFSALLARLPAFTDRELAEFARGFARMYLESLEVETIGLNTGNTVPLNAAFWIPCPGTREREADIVEAVRTACGGD